jgi:hypothetical protein
MNTEEASRKAKSIQEIRMQKKEAYYKRRQQQQ